MLLRHKGLVTWKEWPTAAWLGKPSAKDRVVDFLRTSAPLRAWLDARVGPERPGAAGAKSGGVGPPTG